VLNWIRENRNALGVAVVSSLIVAAVLAAVGVFGNVIGGGGDNSGRGETTTQGPTPSTPVDHGTTTETTPTTPTTPPEPCVQSAKLSAPYEPNENMADAAGPLKEGAEYRGQIETTNDMDWYAFCVGAKTQVRIALTALSDARIGASLRSQGGDELDTTNASLNGSGSISYSVEPGRYFVELHDYCCDEKGRYSLRVTAPGGLTDTVAAG
jgi:hypothetical protein